MIRTKITVILSISLILFVLAGCSLLDRDITIVDVKTAVSVDQDFNPVSVKDVFPKGTSTVTCWLKWRDAKINTQILVKWHYVTDDIHITDHAFIVPKKNGMGGITLTMPEGKKLPPGNYKVSVTSNNRILKSITFSVE